MKRIAIIALLLWAAPANAASIVFTITAGGGANATKSYTLTDAEILRVIAANQIAANAAMNRPATRPEVLLYWIGQFMNQTKAAVQSNDRQTAIDAIPAPTPINPQ